MANITQFSDSGFDYHKRHIPAAKLPPVASGDVAAGDSITLDARCAIIRVLADEEQSIRVNGGAWVKLAIGVPEYFSVLPVSSGSIVEVQ